MAQSTAPIDAIKTDRPPVPALRTRRQAKREFNFDNDYVVSGNGEQLTP